LSDIMVFGGDASKARLEEWWPSDDNIQRTDLIRYTSILEARHQESNWEPAVQVSTSRAVILQGLVWGLKLAVVENPTEEEFRQTVDRYVYDLAQEVTQAQEGVEIPIQPGPSIMDQLDQLATLHDQGALTDEEFAAAKARLLGQP